MHFDFIALWIGRCNDAYMVGIGKMLYNEISRGKEEKHDEFYG